MSNKKSGLILLGVSFLIIAGFGVWKMTKNNDTVTQINPSLSEGADSTSDASSSQKAPGAATGPISVDEVKKHNSKDDCWTIVNDKVYDITTYIASHPGGEVILEACGQDGTQLFTSRTDSDGEAVGSGTPHSPTAESVLADFFVGELAA